MSRYRSSAAQVRVMPVPVSGTGSLLFWAMVWILVIAVLAITAPLMAAGPSFPGLGHPGKPTKLWIHVGHTDAEAANQSAKIVGPDDRLQLVVSTSYDSGQIRDHSRSVRYMVTPEQIVRIEPGGRVVPLADGKVTVTVESPENLKASVSIEVEHFANPPAVNFSNEVVPIFTKTGCNSGGCHGKSGGQNGFRLSLLGFEPKEDYEYLVREGRGRRLFPAAPDHSLLLLKAVNTMPHGGGGEPHRDGFA